MEFDKRISHLEFLAANVNDTQTVAAIGVMTKKVEAEKSALHPIE
ncbi:hypothetical protein [Bradyrhizobium sp. McL0616]